MAGLFLMQPVVGMQMASRRAKKLTPRSVSLPSRRLREAKSISRPASPLVKAVIRGERLPLATLTPLVERRDVVVNAMFCVTADVVTENGAGGVQVTPDGTVPVAVHVSVTVPVKEMFGVRTRGTLPELPAVRVIEVEVLPVLSARLKSGVGAPIPSRAAVSGFVDAEV